MHRVISPLELRMIRHRTDHRHSGTAGHRTMNSTTSTFGRFLFPLALGLLSSPFLSWPMYEA